MTPSPEPSALVERLRTTVRTGRTRPLSWRVSQLRRLKRMLLECEEAIDEAVSADLGRHRVETWTHEIGLVVSEIDTALTEIETWVLPERVSVPSVMIPAAAEVVCEPLGVVLIIGPWDYPFLLLLGPLVGALAAGDTAVLKPSEHAPASAALLARQVPRYLDTEAVQVVEGGPDVAASLVEAAFDHVFFTGSSRLGRSVAEACARRLVPCTLELGGQNPCIVDAATDLEIAGRRIAWGRFINAGQTCVAPNHVLVPRSAAEDLTAAVRKAVRSFYGADPRSSPDFGRIVSVSHLDRLAGLLEGLERVEGGDMDRDARYLGPTLVLDPPLDHPVLQEEIFGPILPIVPVEDLDAAIETVAARPPPLVVYLFSRDGRAQEKVRSGTRSGSLVFNDTVVHLAVPGLPFGGLGASGWGACHGRAGFEAMSHRRSVLTRSTRFDVAVRYPPYSQNRLRWTRKLM
ncbi:MAG: aldehyde dehydrogenase family protein [Deltaproteobacteria bacterium]|nr:aldehyde dehydrogenase family protein [Deltaproteobacteria bacterium]